ncbi:hypothetical protein DFH08DRAFT_953341 [Mycena albidolilacea]|uniref:Variable large protein n=1 Tax=Mycena albidolilacea TaxID=1033008 RepID=A0AAD7AGH7_9AGAR|nr:hypothetical protein DFH08DRAFT_953341 [Mycena albidolilacea]
MVRMISVYFTLFLAAFAATAPLQASQVGNAQCQTDRKNIVLSLLLTTSAVGKIDTTDPATATAVEAAEAGLQSAAAGIMAIGAALQSGENAPSEDRDQVSAGLTAARNALTGINDKSVNATVTNALNKLDKAIAAGKAVVVDCK